MGYDGVLPLEQIQRNIKSHRLPFRGCGNARMVTITPSTIQFFIKPSHIGKFAQDKFGISDLSQVSTSKEQAIYDAHKRQQIFSGALTLDSLDILNGVYLLPDQCASVLPDYDPKTFLLFAKEAGLKPEEIPGQGHAGFYLLNMEILQRLPRLNLTEQERLFEIYTHKRIQQIASLITRESLDLEHGVWLLGSQAAKLMEKYTAAYFKRNATAAGIKRSDIFGTERYFVTKEGLEKLPNKQLTQDQIQMVTRLASFIGHDQVGSAFEISGTYVSILAGQTKGYEKAKGKNLIHSDSRLEQAIYAYFDFPTGPVRGLIYDNVLLPLSQLMGKTSTKEIGSFTTPYYLLHRNARGVREQREREIAELLEHCITCYTLREMMDFASTHRELPQVVTDEVPLPQLGNSWTITNYFYLTVMQHFRQRVSIGIQKQIESYQEGLTGLDPKEQDYLILRYGLNNTPDMIDWRQPTHEVIALAMNIPQKELSKLEGRIMAKLKQPDFHPYLGSFDTHVYTFLFGLKKEFELLKRPIEGG